MVKRLLSAFVALLVCLNLMAPVCPVSAASPVTIVVDGVRLSVTAINANGSTIVPMRAIFEQLDATVSYDAATKTITAEKGDITIVLVINKATAYIDGEPTTLATPPTITGGATYVPLRFVSEALGGSVAYNPTTKTVTVVPDTGEDDGTLPGSVVVDPTTPGVVHSGTIQPAGEVWKASDKVHIVRDTFFVEGANSPVLTIEAGCTVMFEAGAHISVGESAPGGLRIQGTPSQLVTLTARSVNPTPGFWAGIWFYDQTLKDNAVIENARIDWAGEDTENGAALYVYGSQRPVSVKLKDVQISNSLNAGICLDGVQSRLTADSDNLTIVDTKSGSAGGGFPVITSAYGSHNLPKGQYYGNEINAVNINNNSQDTIKTNTTWRNIGVPYACSYDIYVEGSSSPTLTIEPGVVTLWAADSALVVGSSEPGSLNATAGSLTGRLDDLLLFADSKLTKTSVDKVNPYLKNNAIIFGAWSDSPADGFWEGIELMGEAGGGNAIDGAVVAWGGSVGESYGGVYMESFGAATKLKLANSLISGSASAGAWVAGTAQFSAGSTNNHITDNAIPLFMSLNSVGSLPEGNVLTGNEQDHILVGVNTDLASAATWANHGVPYVLQESAYLQKSLTISAGTTVMFGSDARLQMEEGAKLVAVGSADRPIVFTSVTGVPGSWYGVELSDGAGVSQFDHVLVENSEWGIVLNVDFGPMITNSTFQNNTEAGIYRYYASEDEAGTSFIDGLGNVFSDNGVDEI